MKNIRVRFFFATMSLLFGIQTFALDVNDFTFKHLTHSDGLCSQRIYSIKQTTDGALWWAAKNCVERYNGVDVKCYKLNAPEGVSFQAGRYLKLWLSADGVLYAFDNKGEIFEYSSLKNAFSLKIDLRTIMGSEMILNDIHIFGNTIFLATEAGVYTLDGQQLTPVKEGVVANTLVAVGDKVYICTVEGVFEFQPSIGVNSLKAIVTGNVVSGFYDEHNGCLWLGCFTEGVKVVSFAKNGKVSSVESVVSTDIDIKNPVRSIAICNDETMLLGIDGMGVYKASRKAGESGNFYAEPLFDANNGQRGVLGGNGVYSVICDCWGNIVVGSYSGGIDIAHPVGMASKIFRHQHNNQQSILNNHVNTVIQTPDGRLVMGTDNGVSVYDEKNNSWVHSSNGSVVIDLCVLDNGTLTAATYGGGVLEILPDGRAKQIYSVRNGVLKDDYVYCIYEDRDNGLWMGCLDGPLVYKNKSGLKYFDLHNVKDILQLPDGNVAVGTVNGLFVITPNTGEIEEFNYSPAGAQDVSRYVCALYLQGDKLWIGTDGGGVYLADMKVPEERRQILLSNGLPSNTISSICEDMYGRILIATDYGLAYVDTDYPDKVINVNYGYDIDCEYVGSAVAKLSDGRILYGTTTGALIINPDSLKELDYAANLNVIGVRYDVDGGGSVQEESVAIQNGRIDLSYDNSTFDLCFECINLSNQNDIAYCYKIEDEEWSEHSSIQHIRFINMKPGEYNLTLRCVSNSCGDVLDEEVITIRVAHPWWSSWWMWVIYSLIIILAFYGSWYFYRLHTQYMHLVVNNPKLFTLPVTIRRAEKQAAAEKADDGKDFVEKATNLIVQYLSDSDFNIDRLCREMAMSRTMFYLKLKAYTGKSPQDFIRVIRLERAAALLRSGTSVADAAAMTGFDNAKYFSTVFKKYFGVSPSKCR